VGETKENAVWVGPLTIGPDASYSFEEIRVTDSTCVTGFGVKAFFIRDKSDMKQG
jgi:hypothetical protein